jgi:hypothetical protein
MKDNIRLRYVNCQIVLNFWSFWASNPFSSLLKNYWSFIIKAIHDKFIANIISNEGKTETIFPKVKKETRVPILPTLIQYNFEIPSQTNKTGGRNFLKRYLIGKEEDELSLFADDMILYLKTQSKILTNHKHFQQSSRIQNQYTKFGSFSSIYQLWTDWERSQKNNSVHSSPPPK